MTNQESLNLIAYLYDLAMSELREHRKEISEINVEDPNEAFADMRDKRDVAFLAKNQVIQGLEAPLSREKVMKLKEQYKMNKVRKRMEKGKGEE